ncbi:MAG TPA: 50S ribosomal protein L25 [Candidatus Dojkabacteria bacterium]|nr:50S ribosomal protein L25 [Candidatus Dojkabacteria bacterium]
MEKITLQKRETIGDSSKSLKKGLVPAVMYNDKTESYNIQISTSEALNIAKNATSTTILDADYDGKAVKVLAKDFDFNPVTGELRHISFFQIDETKPMQFTVPFHITGISPAVKNNLGVLVKALNAIDVRCALADLKPFIEIDISMLEHPGQTISVSDIRLPKGMTLPNESQMHSAIVTVTQLQKTEVENAPTTTAEEATTTTPETTEEAPKEA